MSNRKRSSKKVNEVEVLQVISWMDGARWEDEKSHQSYLDDVIKKLGSSKKLLVHWLIYIADRQTQVRGTDFWKRGCRVYSELVRDLQKTRYSNFKEFKEKFLDDYFFDEYLSDKKDKKHKKIVQKFHVKDWNKDEKQLNTKEKNEFTPRLPLDRYLTLRTIYFLNRYHNNDFLGYLKKNYKSSESESGYDLDRIAYLLYLLSYWNKKEKLPTNVKKLDDLAPIFDRQVEEIKQKSENIDNDDFERWKGNEEEYYFKRVWAALRDYIKHPVFKDDFSKAIFGRKWESPPIDLLRQLQLPGDLWNERSPLPRGICRELGLIFENTSKKGTPLKSIKKSPKLAREIFDEIKNTNSNFYPEQFDVTFDFSPNMSCGKDNLRCKKEICPFGDGALDVCSGKEGKPCTVLLITCGYNVKCKPRKCPIKVKKGKGFCVVTRPK